MTINSLEQKLIIIDEGLKIHFSENTQLINPQVKVFPIPCLINPDLGRTSCAIRY